MSRYSNLSIIGVIVIIVGVAGYYLLVNQQESVPMDENMGAEPSDVASGDAVPIIDGVVDTNEYENSYSTNSGVNVYWETNGANLLVGLESPGKGWIAIGFDPDQAMRGANYVFGYVADGATFVSDEYGVSNFGHRPDTMDGGSDDILDYAGVETSELTIIEFVIPLDSGDFQDKLLELGETYSVLLAYNNSDDSFTSKHSRRDSFDMKIS